MSLVPPGGDDSSSPRRAISPLLEPRRPHCTLACDYCAAVLEDKFKLSEWRRVVCVCACEGAGRGGAPSLV
ncbi:unnamed protein product [Plutella xylostella]|uniref:(diamondback moth) hypothetical protein n=1 Tax=Plutella xylostella TaxID=51655 RepID=A0A8S4EAK9_PLUXY|nr:unnamed protein product [Plutella xylostella]